MHSITPARLLVMFSGAFLLAGNASAYVQQRVQLDYSGPAGATTHAADTVSVPPESALHTIHANIAGGFGSAVGSVGTFGDLGVQAYLHGLGKLTSLVSIYSDEFVNPFASARHAQSRFVVDGGSLWMIAGNGSTLDFSLELQARILDSLGHILSSNTWEATIGLAETATGTEFHTTGESLGASLLGPGRVRIPLSFQTFDIGDIPAGGSMTLSYELAIEGIGARFVELMNWDFSDPLHVDGSGILSSVSLGTTAAVPEPPVWVLFAGGLGALCRARRQRS
ncbi:MAG: hypothetical protein V5B38_08150 [Candidatus Accumulibacter propinquus]|jgi:hypothetical protein